MQDKTPRNEQGAAHGYWEIYHDNGQLKIKGLFINGKRFGKYEWFFDDGRIFYIINYINDIQHGYTQTQSFKIYYAR